MTPATPAALGGRLSGHFGLVFKAVRDVRGAALGGGAVALVFVLLDVLLYPSFRDAVKDFEYPAAVRGMLGEAGSIASPEGFMTAQFFNVTPLVFVAVAIIAGTAATAGEEVDGTLDLAAVSAVGAPAAVAEQVDRHLRLPLAGDAGRRPRLRCSPARSRTWTLGMGRFFAAEVNVLLLESVFLTFALLAGAVCPSRPSAVALSVSAMVACYLLPTLRGRLRLLRLRAGGFAVLLGERAARPHPRVRLARAALLFAASVVFLGLAVWRFQRRDIAAGRARVEHPSRPAGGAPSEPCANDGLTTSRARFVAADPSAPARRGGIFAASIPALPVAVDAIPLRGNARVGHVE